MRFGLSFVNGGSLVEPESAVSLAHLAEELGFSTLWTAAHVVVPSRFRSNYPGAGKAAPPFDHDTPIADPATFLGFLAAATRSIRLATGVLVLAQHNPLEVAKAYATLDRLSGGRVTMGIGTGWLREEFDAVGIPFEKRLARTLEGIEVLRRLWSAPEASYRGAHFAFESVTCSPRPVQAGGIPIYLGGQVPAAARRAGRVADGHYPGPATLEEVKAHRAEVAQGAEEVGRDPETIRTVISLPPGLVLTRDLIRRYEHAGVDEIIIPVPRASGLSDRTPGSFEFDHAHVALHRFQAEVMEP